MNSRPMISVQVDLEESHIHFLEEYEQYGFQNKASLIRSALNQLKHELESAELETSADLYAEVYETCENTQDLTKLALTGWPE